MVHLPDRRTSALHLTVTREIVCLHCLHSGGQAGSNADDRTLTWPWLCGKAGRDQPGDSHDTEVVAEAPQVGREEAELTEETGDPRASPCREQSAAVDLQGTCPTGLPAAEVAQGGGREGHTREAPREHAGEAMGFFLTRILQQEGYAREPVPVYPGSAWASSAGATLAVSTCTWPPVGTGGCSCSESWMCCAATVHPRPHPSDPKGRSKSGPFIAHQGLATRLVLRTILLSRPLERRLSFLLYTRSP